MLFWNWFLNPCFHDYSHSWLTFLFERSTHYFYALLVTMIPWTSAYWCVKKTHYSNWEKITVYLGDLDQERMMRDSKMFKQWENCKVICISGSTWSRTRAELCCSGTGFWTHVSTTTPTHGWHSCLSGPHVNFIHYLLLWSLEWVLIGFKNTHYSIWEKICLFRWFGSRTHDEKQ